MPNDRRTLDSKDIDIFNFNTVIAVRKARALAQSYIELHTELGLNIPNLYLVHR